MTTPAFEVGDRVWWHHLEVGGERGERQDSVIRRGTVLGIEPFHKFNNYDYTIVPDDDRSDEVLIQEYVLHALCLLDELAEIPE